jgi:hypothetical protein
VVATCLLSIADRLDGRRPLFEVTIGRIELPLRNCLDLDLDPRTEGVDLFRKVKVDNGSVVKADTAREGVQANLQPTVKIPPMRRFEKIDHVHAKKRVGECPPLDRSAAITLATSRLNVFADALRILRRPTVTY